MKIRKRTIVLLIVAAIILAIIYGVYSSSQAPKKVTTQTVERGDLEVIVSASGKIQSKNTAELSFTGAGRISSLPFKEGDAVKKGQTLAYLDGSSVKQQENKAWADYRLALEKLREFENNNKDKPKTDTYMISKAQLEAQRDGYAALVSQTRTGYQDKTLVSPIDGTISSITTQVGETPGTEPVITVIDESQLEFVAEVDEQDIGSITTQYPAEIILDAYSGLKFTGTVNKIESIAKTGSSGNTYYPVKIEISDPNAARFLIGMSGDADIKTNSKQNVVLLPLELILDEDDKRFVYVLENGVVQKKEIEIGLESDAEAEVISGLQPGEVVITGDTSTLQAGVKAVVQE